MFSKAIFLNVDGVIHPLRSTTRFDHINEFGKIAEELSQKIGVDYCKYHPNDIGAVYFDWDKNALEQLQRILDMTGARIIILSDWRRYEGLDRMVDFFKIYGMDKYLVEAINTPPTGDRFRDLIDENQGYKNIQYRSIEILEYLKANPHIKKYVAIDDIDLSNGLGEFAITTKGVFSQQDADRCISILNS